MPDIHIKITEATKRELERLSEIYDESKGWILETAFWLAYTEGILTKYLDEVKKEKERRLGKKIGIMAELGEEEKKKRDPISEIVLDYDNPEYEILWTRVG